jgi:hypothetical protein
MVSTPARTPALVATSPPSPSPRGEAIKEPPQLPIIDYYVFVLVEAVPDVAPLRLIDNPRLSAKEVVATVLFQMQPQTRDLP